MSMKYTSHLREGSNIAWKGKLYATRSWSEDRDARER
jgi:hypothetical protein